jgi:hypothetical protein
MMVMIICSLNSYIIIVELSRPWSYLKKFYSWPRCLYISVHSYHVIYAYYLSYYLLQIWEAL